MAVRVNDMFRNNLTELRFEGTPNGSEGFWTNERFSTAGGR